MAYPTAGRGMTAERESKTRAGAAVTARFVRCLQASAQLADSAPKVSRARAQTSRGDATWQQRLEGYRAGGILTAALTRTGDRVQPRRATRAGDRQRRPPPTVTLLARTQQQLAVLRDRASWAANSGTVFAAASPFAPSRTSSATTAPSSTCAATPRDRCAPRWARRLCHPRTVGVRTGSSQSSLPARDRQAPSEVTHAPRTKGVGIHGVRRRPLHRGGVALEMTTSRLSAGTSGLADERR